MKSSHFCLSCPNPSYLFMLTQEVSKMPISRSTPSRMSLMTSGGMRRERISDKASGLMFPTACFASSTKGYSREKQVKAKHASQFRFWSKAEITSFIHVPVLLLAHHQFWPFFLQSFPFLEPFSTVSFPFLSSGHWHSK